MFSIATFIDGSLLIRHYTGVFIAVIILFLVLLFHYYLHRVNPYSSRTIFKVPYTTHIVDNQIEFTQNYRFVVHGSKIANLFGYYVSGFLIVKNTFTGGQPTKARDERGIIDEIHRVRFNPTHPYLISGDQFSVLYTRNLGVFYNQLLDPAIALSHEDWQNKQRIYLQSVLVAIDGLSASSDPRTTVVPISPHRAVLTQVHPGGIGSDQVYGLLYALSTLRTPVAHTVYKLQTVAAADRILLERKRQLIRIVSSYINAVQDPATGFVYSDLHLASARDGVIRSSSLYDNIILWKTLNLAAEVGLYEASGRQLNSLKQRIRQRYWNETKGYYNDDLQTPLFSADWLIGFPADFFDLTNKQDLRRTEQIVKYIEGSNLIKPFPIKYQESNPKNVPWFVKLVVPSYGGSAIWSYWGAEYITLLMRLYEQTGTLKYLKLAEQYQASYARKIVEDRGFAETFDESGQFLKTSVYKSIRITGWVVQYEHAVQRIAAARAKR